MAADVLQLRGEVLIWLSMVKIVDHMKQQSWPTASGTLISPAALREIFQEELRSGPIPSEAHLVELASMTVPLSAVANDDLAIDFVRDVGAPLYDELCRTVDCARQALDNFRSQIPDDDWIRILRRTRGLEALQVALDETAPTLQPPRPVQPKRGHPDKPDEHLTAWGIAEATRAALQAAGHKGPISITSDNGPAARIGSRVLAVMLRRNVLPSATFADWVRKHLGDYPNLID